MNISPFIQIRDGGDSLHERSNAHASPPRREAPERGVVNEDEIRWRILDDPEKEGVERFRDELMEILSESGNSYQIIGLVLRCDASTVCRRLQRLRRRRGESALPAALQPKAALGYAR